MRDSQDLLIQAKRLRFQGELEALFLDDYNRSSVGLCRAAFACATLLFLAFGFLDPYAIPSHLRQVWAIRFGLVFPVLALIVALSFFPFFRRIMQPAMSASLLVTGGGLIWMTTLARPDELGYLLYPMGLLLVPMVGYSFVRLRFWYATLANLANVLLYLWAAIWLQHALDSPRGVAGLVAQMFFIGAINIVGIATCYSLELYARRAWASNYLLEGQRAGEQRERERSEALLLLLSRAIGSIIHDLGNPLTSVQVGAQTLDLYLDNGLTSPVELRELTSIIIRGSKMLDHLRLSLIEQTRALEGKPIPVELAPTPVRALVEAGVEFQKPMFLIDRTISVHGDEELHIEADALKMTTVWMNLVGNALKYSDGEVRVEWRRDGEWALISVSDAGQNGQGLSPDQAAQLFTAFSRLEAHRTVEGTGLGLLSVRAVVEAHGGEAFIEGWTGETRFSTASRTFAPVLADHLRTAFVVALPLPKHPPDTVENAPTRTSESNGAPPQNPA